MVTCKKRESGRERECGRLVEGGGGKRERERESKANSKGHTLYSFC